MIDQIGTLITEAMEGNEFFQGGIILAAFGFLAAWGRNLPAILQKWFRKCFVVELDIQQGNFAFDAMVYWLSQHSYMKKTRRQTACADRCGDTSPKLEVSPAPGTHLIWFEGWPVFISRGREQSKEGGILLGFYEDFSLSAFCPKNLLQKLLQEALNALHEKERGGPTLYVHDGFGGWSSLGSIRGRPLDSVILPEGILDTLVSDLSWFLSSIDWYVSIGVPYRRGYLLHGPPGTGKTSVCLALASCEGMDVAVISLSSRGMDDTKLVRFLNSLPSHSVILLEDVDCLFKNDRSAKTEAGGVTLSGLLNAIDGAATREGQILFMTTNHLEQIDPALIRPGRADIVIELGLATLHQLEGFFQKFFPEVDPTSAKEFAASVGEKKKSPAEVQQWLMKHKSNPEIAKQGRFD